MLTRRMGYVVVLGSIALMSTACNNGSDTDMSYKAAINDHFKTLPVCIWSQSKKFPVQAATSDDAKTEGYDALTQEGLLTRTTAEKKVLIVASKQVNNYDLSEKGRTSWTPDSTQPGYGNFCYGHREVTSIDNSTPGTNSAGVKTVAISYHYQIANVADWANSPEIKTAYPGLASSLGSNPSDNATLVMTGDHWAYTK
ncbi:MAG: hypothetical protein WAN65_06685 [Candidatus Sulfotelmatobacter sp.]